jgi:hypothetical protein
VQLPIILKLDIIYLDGNKYLPLIRAPFMEDEVELISDRYPSAKMYSNKGRVLLKH